MVCNICYDNLADCMTRCKHSFCGSCTEQWFIIHKNVYCPLCRTTLINKKKEYSSDEDDVSSDEDASSVIEFFVLSDDDYETDNDETSDIEKEDEENLEKITFDVERYNSNTLLQKVNGLYYYNNTLLPKRFQGKIETSDVDLFICCQTCLKNYGFKNNSTLKSYFNKFYCDYCLNHDSEAIITKIKYQERCIDLDRFYSEITLAPKKFYKENNKKYYNGIELPEELQHVREHRGINAIYCDYCYMNYGFRNQGLYSANQIHKNSYIFNLCSYCYYNNNFNQNLKFELFVKEIKDNYRFRLEN